MALIQDSIFREAMEEAPYNAGRTMADVSNKTYVHGTRKYLRPDTMWADDRYSAVTSDEIKEAKQRYVARLKKEGKELRGPLVDPHLHLDHDYGYTGTAHKHIYAYTDPRAAAH